MKNSLANTQFATVWFLFLSFILAYFVRWLIHMSNSARMMYYPEMDVWCHVTWPLQIYGNKWLCSILVFSYFSALT